MRPFHSHLAAFLSAALLATVSTHAEIVVVAPPARGMLVQRHPVRTRSISNSDFSAALAASTSGSLLLQLAGTPTCGIDVFKLQYYTVGGAGEPTTASAAVMVPRGDNPQCRGPRPVLLYAHGTQINQNFDIGRIENIESNNEGAGIAAVFAAQGYVVVAPNYAGYDTSTLPYHPYLNADQQSKDMIDGLAAARRAFPELLGRKVTDSGELFVTGFAEGGHVAMATHRALQTLGVPVAASVPIAGPYALAAYADEILAGRVSSLVPTKLMLIIDSYQHTYGSANSVATDSVQPQYANNLQLLPTNDPNVFAQHGPQPQPLASRQRTSERAPIPPGSTPANMMPLFAVGFGSSHQYLLDARTNPDNEWPTATTSRPAQSPANTLRQAFERNDLRNWSPTSPLMMCGGGGSLNTMNGELMEEYWASVGAARWTSVLDLDTTPMSPADPYATLKEGFAASKETMAATAVAQGATDGGALVVRTVLEGPYCFAAAHLFFEQHRHAHQAARSRSKLRESATG